MISLCNRNDFVKYSDLFHRSLPKNNIVRIRVRGINKYMFTQILCYSYLKNANCIYMTYEQGSDSWKGVCIMWVLDVKM